MGEAGGARERATQEPKVARWTVNLTLPSTAGHLAAKFCMNRCRFLQAPAQGCYILGIKSSTPAKAQTLHVRCRTGLPPAALSTQPTVSNACPPWAADFFLGVFFSVL